MYGDLNFQGKNLQGRTFINMDLRGANFEGANLFGSDLEDTLLDNVRYDNDTKYFQMYCPIEGPFLGYKKCYNFRIVQLLILADAKRSSATRNTCRCDKVKVLTIKSIDCKDSFDEAISYVDENFVYKVGQWVKAENFNEYRWVKSTTGIHFFMTREEAIGYL